MCLLCSHYLKLRKNSKSDLFIFNFIEKSSKHVSNRTETALDIDINIKVTPTVYEWTEDVQKVGTLLVKMPSAKHLQRKLEINDFILKSISGATFQEEFALPTGIDRTLGSHRLVGSRYILRYCSLCRVNWYYSFLIIYS